LEHVCWLLDTNIEVLIPQEGEGESEDEFFEV
jgi:hypothetical protein